MDRALELQIQRQLTLEYINTWPTDITLTPNARVRTADGGWKTQAQTPREPITVRLLEANAAQSTMRTPTPTQGGVARIVDVEILAPYDAAIEIGDTFDHDGAEYEVVGMMLDLEYEKRASAVRRGR